MVSQFILIKIDLSEQKYSGLFQFAEMTITKNEKINPGISISGFYIS